IDSHIKSEDVLPILDLAQALAFAHHDPIADRSDADARERQRLREITAQILERTSYARLWNLRLRERARGAQHDQVLEGELVLAARAARRFDEAAVDQPLNGTARQLQDTFHVPHAVGMHRDSLR